MKTIKFRAKDIVTGVWKYGYYARLSNEFQEWHCIMTEQDASTKYIKDCNSFEMIYTAVDAETVCQFTGLYDKNCKEIYEGDIVCYYETRSRCINPDCEPYNYIYEDVLKKVIVEIKFDDGRFIADDEDDDFKMSLCMKGFFDSDLAGLRELLCGDEENEYIDADGNVIDETKLGIEVIGNIYDNPELLNEEKL